MLSWFQLMFELKGYKPKLIKLFKFMLLMMLWFWFKYKLRWGWTDLVLS